MPIVQVLVQEQLTRSTGLPLQSPVRSARGRAREIPIAAHSAYHHKAVWAPGKGCCGPLCKEPQNSCEGGHLLHAAGIMQASLLYCVQMPLYFWLPDRLASLLELRAPPCSIFPCVLRQCMSFADAHFVLLLESRLLFGSEVARMFLMQMYSRSLLDASSVIKFPCLTLVSVLCRRTGCCWQCLKISPKTSMWQSCETAASGLLWRAHGYVALLSI